MEVWVWDTQTRCQNRQTPNAIGTVIADGKCRTVQTSTPTSSSNYRFLPGTYQAVCTSNGKDIRFDSSGCKDSQCSSLTVGADVCDRDTASESSLFSRLSPPEYEVKDPNSLSDPAFFSCSRVVGDGITVTFTVFGDCSACISGGSGTDDGPLPSPTQPPMTKPLSPPTDIPSTRRPVYPYTQKPVRPDTPNPSRDPTPKPATPKPTPKPTINPTNRPVVAPVEHKPTQQPIKKPSLLPTQQPMKRPSLLPTLIPFTSDPYQPTTIPTTIHPSQSPVGLSLPPSVPTRTELINVAVLLSTIAGTLPNEALNAWENVTVVQIKRVASAEIASVAIFNIEQQLLNVKGEIISLLTVSPLGRDLGNDDQASSMLINFDLQIAFYESTPKNMTAKSVFDAAFATEADRTQYLINLANTGYFGSSVKEMKPIDDGSFPFNETTLPLPSGYPSATPLRSAPTVFVPDPIVKDEQPVGGGTNLFLIVGSLVLAVALLIAFGLFFYHRGKKDALSTKDDKGKGGSQSTMSNNDRWTNEILVDREVDDVSTLGGSILAGLQLVEGVHGPEDERTASVNVDYDYVRHRYRSGTVTEDVTVDDIRSRSVSDKSNPTTLTTYSKLGMLRDLGSAVLADDISFEQQYNAGEDDDATNEYQSGSAPGPFRDFSFSGMRMSKPFQIHAPPGLLGMVIDTPGGGVPVVRAIKSSSALCESVMVGDRLIAVDHIDVTNMSAVEVSSLISTKSHLHRLLVFVRPQGEKT